MAEQVTGAILTATTKVTLTSATPGGINAVIASISGAAAYTGLTGVFEIDDGTATWAGVNSQDSAGTPGTQATGTITPGSSAAKIYWISCPGVTAVRWRTTALSTGTPQVRLASMPPPLTTANITV